MPRPMYFASFAKNVFLRTERAECAVSSVNACAWRDWWVCGAQLVFCQWPDHRCCGGRERHRASVRCCLLGLLDREGNHSGPV